MAELSHKYVKLKSSKIHLIGIKRAHLDMGFEDLSAYQDPQLQKIVTGARRLRGEADTKGLLMTE